MLRSSASPSSRRAPRRALLPAALAAFLVALAIPVGSAWASNSTAVAVSVPNTSDAGPIPNAVVTSVSCPSAGTCTAVGEYQDNIGITHAMTLNYASGTWTSVEMYAPTNAPDYTFSDLNAVSCVSVGNCVAVGDYRVSTIAEESFYAVETSGNWARGVALPVPSDAGSDPAETSFTGVSCVPGGTTCQLLGEYLTSSPLGIVHSAVDTYVFGTGLSGTVQEIAQTSGQDGIGLNSIACTAAASCVAVGAQASAESETAAYSVEASGVWSPAITLQNPNDTSTPEEYLSSISCVSTGNCVTGGDWLSNNGNAYAETYTLSGGSGTSTETWNKPVTLGEPSTLNDPFVDAISCVGSVTECTLSGSLTNNQGELLAATAQMTDGHWGQLAAATAPSGAVPDHELLGISCAAGNECTAVGYYNTGGITGGTEGMGATWVTALPPGPVTSLAVRPQSDTSLHASWQAPADTGSGIGHYEVTTQIVGGSVKDDGPFTPTSATITNLQPGATYRVRVDVVATDGQTSSVAEATVTLPATLPSAVRSTSAVGVVHGLRITWGAPSSTGGSRITSYKVAADCSGTMRTMHVGDATHKVTMAGLPGNVSCVVRVWASNKVGIGPSSAPVIAKTLS